MFTEKSRTPEIVYVIDDDEAMRDSLQWLLEGKGYSVRCHKPKRKPICHPNTVNTIY